MHVVAVAVPPEIAPATYRRLLSAVAAEQQARISRFHRPVDGHRTMIADILARTVICRAGGLMNWQLRFTRSQYGKPCLAMPAGLEYNVSHAGRWVVAAVHTAPVGIDIEEIRPIEDAVGQRFFSEQEYSALRLRTGDDRLAFFYDLWTAKESYLKFTGEGMMQRSLQSFSITFAAGQITFAAGAGTSAGGYDPAPLEPGAQPAYFRQYDIDPAYRMTTCAGSPECFPARLEVIEFDALVHEFARYAP